MAEDNMCHLPVSTGEDLVVTELDVRRQTGLPSHLLAQLGEDPSAFCSGVWPRADLSSSRAAGRKASAFPVGLSTGTSQQGSFLHQNGAVRRARGGGEGKREAREGLVGEKVNLL